MNTTTELLEIRQDLREMRREVRRIQSFSALFGCAIGLAIAYWYAGPGQISADQIRLGRGDALSIIDPTKAELNGYQGRRIWIDSNDASITFGDASSRSVRVYSEFGKLIASTRADDGSIVKKRLF